MFTTSTTFLHVPSEELLHSEHLSPNELEVPAPGGNSEDKGGLQPLDSKDGELTQISINSDFGRQTPSFLIPQSLGESQLPQGGGRVGGATS